MISTDDVQKLADLAHLSVTDNDAGTLATEMDAILEYVKDVNTLTGDVQKSDQKPTLRNIMRDDEVTNTPGEYTEAIVKQFPDRDGNALRVTKIL